jgi:hypothetical protein
VRGDSWYLVVLAHEEDGQLPDSRHVERLVEEALVGGRCQYTTSALHG